MPPPIEFAGNRLLLNIDCSAMGEAWVELQDESGSDGGVVETALKGDLRVREMVVRGMIIWDD